MTTMARPFSVSYFSQVRRELTDRFGGVTAFVRAPAVGLWKESADDINRDAVVMFEVLAEQLDRDWWSLYGKQLQFRPRACWHSYCSSLLELRKPFDFAPQIYQVG
jgi:hypothetical protein